MATGSVNLMDLFPGCNGLQTDCSGRMDEYDFGSLLGLLPQSGEVDSSGIDLSAEKPITDILVDAGLSGQTAVAIPEELASLLGIQKQSPSPELSRLIPDGVELTQGEIIAGDDTDESLCLRLPLESTSGEEKLSLPLNLRTVEKQGDRLVLEVEVLLTEELETSLKNNSSQTNMAKASDLSSATEEEGKLRLKLELTGFQTNSQTRTQDKQTVGSTENTRQMPRLLSELGARLMVVECVENADEAATVVTSSGSNAELAAFRQSTPWQQSQLNSSDNQIQAIGSKNTESLPVAEKASVEDQELLQTILKGETSTTPTTSSKSEASLTRQENTAFTISEVGVESETAGSEKIRTDSTPTPVKFSNVEYKLDQLKHNPGQKIEIQLVPARLGKMDVSISTFRGQVTVNLTVESAAAGKAVEQNLSQLENKMLASGIKVDAFHVNVSHQEKATNFVQAQNPAYQQGGFYQQYQQQRQNNRQYDNPGRPQQKYQQEDISFDRVMVNCLA